MTDNAIFWAVAAIVMGFVVMALLPPLLSRPRRRGDRNSVTQQIYRAQLAEIDTELAAGRLSADEAETMRAMIGRRLLATASDGKTDQAPAPASPAKAAVAAPAGRSRWWAAGVATVLPVAAIGLYMVVGAPGEIDQPLSGRKDVAENAQAVASVRESIELLEDELTRNPRDLRSWVLLARSLSDLGQYDQAVMAYSAALELAPGEADLNAAYGEALVRAADGMVTAEARGAFQAAVARVPAEPRANYYLALERYQAGDIAAALQGWVRLADLSPPEAPWMPAVQDRIAEASAALGVPSDVATDTGTVIAMAEQDDAIAEEAEAAQPAQQLALTEAEAPAALPAAPTAPAANAPGADALAEPAPPADAPVQGRSVQGGLAEGLLLDEAAADPAPLPESADADNAGDIEAITTGAEIAALVREMRDGIRGEAENARPDAPATAPLRAPPPLDPAIVEMMSQMTPEEQNERIIGMVEGLRARIEANPDDVDGWLILARSYDVLGSLEAARNALDQAATRAPGRVDVQLALVRFLLDGRTVEATVPDDAIAPLERILAQDPGHPDALWFLGLSAAQSRDFDRARDLWQQLLATLDPSTEAYQDMQGYIQALGGTTPAAPDDSPVPSVNIAVEPSVE